jgi:stage II sporulation protein D
MGRGSLLLVRIATGALLLAVVISVIDGQRASVASQAATTVGDIASRAVAYARGLPPTEGTIFGLDPKVVRQTATYAGYPQGPVAPGETHAIPVAIRNQGDDTWEPGGTHAVKLAYHVYDSAGKLVTWDGLRSALPSDVAPGSEATVAMMLTAPAITGVYTIKPDLIRDGEAWFSSQDAAPGSFSLRVTTDMDAGYGPTTAPATIVPGGDVPVDVRVENTGLQAWPAGGPNPVRLGYHWLDGTPVAVVWDGARAVLPHDVQPGEKLAFTVFVRAPRAEGTFILAWDMVQEGVGWFSGHAVATKQELVRVQDGVTLYGKGWGHGIGLSQWGAQGWAEGAAGVRLTGEQIVAKYFPGAQLASHPITSPFRVLLSAPSTGCVGRMIDDVAHMRSAGGMRLVNNADPSVVYLDAAPGQSVRFSVYRGTVLIAVDEWSGQVVFSGEANILALVPKQFWDPITISEKGLSYRGNITIEVRDEGQLRVVNYVSSDDYMAGALPGEMPSQWEMEALRAQAITARTYAAWRQATAGDRTWDVRDDTADQCYGGHSFESARTTAAVASTAGLILTYAGAPIRALYSSADGGITENVGCVLEAEQVGTSWQCKNGWPYLPVTLDPAETAAYDARGPMPYGLWSASFSGAEIRRQIIEDYGTDIGSFVSMEFTMSPGGRPVSVRVRGTDAWVDLKGDRFLRTTLGLNSTLVRTTPF